MFTQELSEKDRSERSYFASRNAIGIQGKNTAWEFFKCDLVFNEKSRQIDVFVPCKLLVKDAAEGKKCNIFAFG